MGKAVWEIDIEGLVAWYRETLKEYYQLVETGSRRSKTVMREQEGNEVERVRLLENALWQEWLYNHSEHCGVDVPPWPHEGICHRPLPSALAASPDMVFLPLLEREEESDALRQRWLSDHTSAPKTTIRRSSA